jgi:excisionase family DNA binding protein
VEQLLSPNQVAKIMGTYPEAVKQWIFRRELPAVRMANGYWRVRKADLEQFLQARSEGMKRRILAVGLDSEALRTFNQALDPSKYEALATDLMADTILKINDLNPAMVIIDVAWTHGWELSEKIRFTKDLRGIPVVILETATGAADIERALKLGVIGCLAKPLNASALADQVATVMRRCI